MQYKITVPQEVRIKAKKALDKMVEILPFGTTAGPTP
jgi:quinolinate synthase